MQAHTLRVYTVTVQISGRLEEYNVLHPNLAAAVADVQKQVVETAKPPALNGEIISAVLAKQLHR